MAAPDSIPTVAGGWRCLAVPRSEALTNSGTILFAQRGNGTGAVIVGTTERTRDAGSGRRRDPHRRPVLSTRVRIARVEAAAQNSRLFANATLSGLAQFLRTCPGIIGEGAGRASEPVGRRPESRRASECDDEQTMTATACEQGGGRIIEPRSGWGDRGEAHAPA